MLNKILALAILFTATAAHAERKNAPFPPYIDERFDQLERSSEEGTTIARKYAKAVYNVATDGGSSTANKSLGVVLPADSVITSFLVYTNTAFTLAGGGTGVGSVALQCTGTRDLMDWQAASNLNVNSIIGRQAIVTASDWSAGGTIIAASKDNQELQVASVPTACEVTAVVRGNSGYEAYTAGKLTAIIEYFTR